MFDLFHHSVAGADRAGEARYSPATCTGTRNVRITGRPDDRLISTSYIERSNLTLRMGSRRFTRLTNAFSKKAENLEHAVSLHLMHYNFARVHSSLRVTPAMAAGVSDHVWELSEIIALLDATEETAREVAGRRKDRQPAAGSK